MKKILPLLLLLFTFVSVFSQEVTIKSKIEKKEIIKKKVILPSKMHSLNSYSALTVEGGLTYVLSDYKHDGMGPAIGGMFEYYFPSRSGLIFGFKAGGGYLQLKGRSDYLITSESGIQTFNFKTDVVYGSGMLNLAYGVKNVIPYIGFGVDFIFRYTPKNTDGFYLLPNKYGKAFAWFSGEGGLRYFVTNNTSVNASVKFNFGLRDDLDGRVMKKKDTYYTLKLGMSYYFFSNIRIK